jgi:hypothetical protein
MHRLLFSAAVIVGVIWGYAPTTLPARMATMHLRPCTPTIRPHMATIRLRPRMATTATIRPEWRLTIRRPRACASL